MVLNDEAIITHELTIKENADGSFMYMGNKIQNDGINRIPDYQYRAQIGTEEIVGIKRSKLSSSIKVNNTNAWAMPDERGVTVSADDNGLKFSWTGYNGTTYSTSNISWDEDISGKKVINIKDYLDTTANPELQGINFSYVYEVDDRIEKSELIDFLDGDKISVSGYGYIEERFNSVSGETLNGVRNSLAAQCSLKVLLEGGADFEIDDHNFIKAANNGNNISKNPLQTGNNADFCEFTFYNDKLGEFTLSSIRPDDKLLLVISENGTPKYTSYYDSATLDDIKNIMEEYQSNKTASQNGELYFPTHNSETTLKTAYGYDYNLLSMGIRITMPLSSNTTADDVLNTYANLGGISLYVEANSTKTSFSIWNDSEYKKTVPVYDDDVNGMLGNKKSISIQSGAKANDQIDIEYDNLRLSSLGIKNVNCKTDKAAKESLEKINRALDIVSLERSDFGAYQNRLEHTIDNLDNVVENTQAAESRIRDTDMATEMVNNTKLNILEQAVTSMMAQANQSTQGVLSLLQ